MQVTDPIRLRLRELLARHEMSQAKLCERLTALTGEPWLIARLSKLLNGHLRMRLEDLVWIGQATGISLVEIVREPGRELIADLTPLELQVLTAVREDSTLIPAILQLLRHNRPQKSVKRQPPPLSSHRRLGTSR